MDEMNLLLAAVAGICMLLASMPMRVLSADTLIDRTVEQDLLRFPVAAAKKIYNGAACGKDPAGYLHPMLPGLHEFVGWAYEQIDNTSGAAGALYCRVRTTGDVKLPLTSVGINDVGRPLYATADDAYALTGHPLAFVGVILGVESSNKALVRAKLPGQLPPNGHGSYVHVLTGHETFTATGATAGEALIGPWELETILGPGFVRNDEEDGGFEMEFDATAEVALSSIRFPNDILPIDKGLRLSLDVNITDDGDAAAIDFDIGFGTALTTSSEASIDHADMVQLVGIHMDGNDTDIQVQSDDNTTDVAATDSTIDYVLGTPFHVDICVSPSGLCQIWIDGVDAGALASKTLQVLSTALVAPFINVEKTSDDTTFRAVVRNIVVMAGQVAAA